MSGFDGSLPEVLAAAIEAARRVLDDLDADEVPAPLRQVASRHGGRLPPPLARRVIREIDRNEWFRSKVAAEIEETADEASVALLKRPDGWWSMVAEASAARRAGKEAARAADLERRNRVLADRLEEAKRRLNQAKADAAAAKVSADRRIEELRARLARSPGGSGAPDRGEQLEELRRRLATAQDAGAEAAATVAALQEDVRRLRRERADAERRLAAGASSSLPSDPIELARFLDLQEAGLGRSATPPPVAAEVPGRLRLPSGIAPDSGEALRWLAAVAPPASVIVDGYNVLHKLDHGAGGRGVGRRRLGDELLRWRRLAAAAHRVVVVYDSVLPEERGAPNSVGGLEVRFAPAGRTADEEVVELAGVLDGPVVVISSDREVREGAEAVGALTLWAEAVTEWVAGR